MNKNSVLLLAFVAVTSIVVSGCTTQENGAGLANPSAVYCEEQGYTYEIRTMEDGSQDGYCVFDDGSECPGWDYYRGECSPVSQGIKPVSLNESLEIARQFVLDSPTYKFDGSGLELDQSIKASCSYCWAFTFEFTSSHGGYGDRTGLVVAQVITPHTVLVAVEESEVTFASLDNRWDMINQEMLRTG